VEAERRQVTVLFTDMVGFTSFSERSGEEAAYTLMRSLSKIMDEAVNEQGGVIRAFTGDGIMAVFGAPVAFEDAPLLACRAALSILQRLKAAGLDLEAKHGVLSSFLKRRLSLPPSSRATALDQIPESLLPTVAIRSSLGLSAFDVASVVIIFFEPPKSSLLTSIARQK
jgi:hypothetical protein